MDEYKWLSEDLGAFKKVKIEMRALLNRLLLITLFDLTLVARREFKQQRV